MSTLALEGSRPVRSGGFSLAGVARYPDVAVLAAALPAFLVAGWPLGGWAAMAGVWIAQRLVNVAARRRVQSALAAGERRRALSLIGWTSLGRAWFVAAAVLVIGLIDRESGLAAGILAAVLFTFYLAGEAIANRRARRGAPEGSAR